METGVAKLERLSFEKKEKCADTCEFFNENLTGDPISIIQLFEKQVALTPNNIAVVFGVNILTYFQLNERVNRLANFLIKKHKIKPGKPIGIMLERSEKMIVGILAIIKTGGFYVPIDPANPLERSVFICYDCDIDLILTDKEAENKGFFHSTRFINLNDDVVYTGPGLNLPHRPTPESLVYIIYTSGSTGTPKGVMIEHRSLVNKLKWMQSRYPLNSGDTVLQKSNFSFDVSVWEMFWPLLNGARLCFLNPGDQKYPDKIIDAIANSALTIVHFVPAMLQLFLNYLEVYPDEISKLSSLKRVFASGEALTVKQVNLFNKLVYLRLGTGLTNQYGPTEATIEVSYYDCESTSELKVVPIGKPISNTALYILNPEGKFLAEGETGELMIAGIQVARGYLNRPELTAEKFVQDPYNPAYKMYLTGDLARRMPDGNLEFLGRIDEQVQISGQRIEPGEIENLILKNEHIKECVVVSVRVDEVDELAAYYVQKQGANGFDVLGELMRSLKALLPAFMIPAFFVELEFLPLNNNGKIDRKSLPLPAERYHQKHQCFIPPLSHTQKIIANILQDTLKIKNISIDDNFFDLGGHSLLLTRSIFIINGKFKSKLTFSNLFQFPTVRQLAKHIENDQTGMINPVVLLKEGKGTPIFLFPGRGGSPLTFNEFLNNYPENPSIYSISYPEDGKNFAFKTLADYASFVVVQIKLLCSAGPYSLLGYSLGGRIVYEIALQLKQQGDVVDMLAIISTPPPDVTSLYGLKEKFRHEIGSFCLLDFNLKLHYLRNRIPYLAKSVIRRLFSKEHQEDYAYMHTDIFLIWEAYQAKTQYTGDILLIKEDQAFYGYLGYKHKIIYDYYLNEDLGWSAFTEGHVAIDTINCNHADFFAEGNVKNIIAIIQNYLEDKHKVVPFVPYVKQFRAGVL